jgi:hypothetical protein
VRWSAHGPVDPSLIGLDAHALGNYISVTAATVEMLQLTLRDHPDHDVVTWIGGIGQTSTTGAAPAPARFGSRAASSATRELLRRASGGKRGVTWPSRRNALAA